jgi:hypothetical protein
MSTLTTRLRRLEASRAASQQHFESAAENDAEMNRRIDEVRARLEASAGPETEIPPDELHRRVQALKAYLARV